MLSGFRDAVAAARDDDGCEANAITEEAGRVLRGVVDDMLGDPTILSSAQ